MAKDISIQWSQRILMMVKIGMCHKYANTFLYMLHDSSLLWRHNGRDGVSNHQRLYCLLKRLFRRGSKITSMLCVTGLCARNSPGTGEFPAQKASNAENVSIWWRHHDGAIPSESSRVYSVHSSLLVEIHTNFHMCIKFLNTFQFVCKKHRKSYFPVKGRTSVFKMSVLFMSCLWRIRSNRHDVTGEMFSYVAIDTTSQTKRFLEANNIGSPTDCQSLWNF